MPLPNFPGKHSLTALFGPADLLRHAGRPGPALPAGAVLVYSPTLLRQVIDRHETTARRVAPMQEVHEVRVPGGTLALAGGFGIGGPAAAAVLEELICSGVREVVSIGGAGGLQPTLAIGDVVVCDAAVRDEGVSYHYLPPDGRYVRPDEGLTARLLREVNARVESVVVGRSWTTDAPYRETRQEVLHYRAEGVLTVEMEAASLAAVARYRGVGFATAFAVMDSLAEDTWRPDGLGHRDALAALNVLFDAAAATLVAAAP